MGASVSDRVSELEAALAAERTRVSELEGELANARARELAAPGADAFLAAVLSSAPMFIVRADPDLRITYINRIQPGIRAEEVYGADIYAFVDPASREAQREVIERVLATGVAEHLELKGPGPNGADAWYHSYFAPVLEPDGRQGICIAAIDVTDAKVRERELVEHQEWLRIALDATGIGLWSLDLGTGKVVWDSRTYELFGRSEPVPLDAYLEEVVHPDDRERLRANATAYAAGGPWPSVTHRIVRPDGEIRWMRASGCTIIDPAGRPVRMVGGNLDITDRIQAEEQLRRAQRLDAVGRFTAGVAHNFNNVLTMLLGSLDLLRRRAGGADLTLIDDARTAALRGADVVRQLMTFSGQRHELERRATSIGEVVDRAVTICQRTFDRHIVLEHHVAADLRFVRCNPAEVEQIVVNLLLNARDAVLDKGHRAPRIRVDVRDARGEADGRPGLEVVVDDDGVGMTNTTLAHLFEPFFTTKPVGKGTGLGLATSFAIARDLGGDLRATSEVGRGSRVRLWLPTTSGERETVEVRDVPFTETRRFRILVVDDEPFLRRVVGEFIRDAGWEALEAECGAAAVTRLADDAAVDLVLLDRSMPGAPGETFIPEIRRLAPSAKIVLFSGQQIAGDVANRVDAIAAKPIAANELCTMIRQVLTRHSHE